jgi:Domain of unknown function (DUF3597)
MSIFSTILDKLGIHKKEDKPATPAAPAQTPATPGNVSPIYFGPPATSPSTPPTTTPHMAPGPMYPPSVTPPMASTPAVSVEMPMVDVVSHLDNLAKASPIELNWRQSINDLMALLGMDHSPAAIKALAVELGCPEKEMADSYSRNVWTHTALLKKIAENGGNIPPSLLH